MTVTIGAVEFYVLFIHANQSDASSRPLLYVVQIVVGLCTSITFSAVASIVALLPDKFHYFFFMGTMCPFFVYLPVNVSTGNLCAVSSNSSQPSMPAVCINSHVNSSLLSLI